MKSFDCIICVAQILDSKPLGYNIDKVLHSTRPAQHEHHQNRRLTDSQEDKSVNKIQVKHTIKTKVKGPQGSPLDVS